ncbi:MAG: hypothetical protein ABFE08_05565 [Armatimonadia bacterium]
MRSSIHNSALLLALVACFLATGAAVAEDLDRATFYLRDIRPVVERLESVSPQNLDGTTNGPQTLDGNYTFDMNPGELMSLRRSFTRSLIDSNTNALKVALQEDTKTEGDLTLSSHFGLSFSSVDTEMKSLLGLSLGSSHSTVMGLQQSFGSGDAASALSLKRTVTSSEALDGSATTTRLEALEFKSGLTKRQELSLKASRSESDALGAPREINLQGVFTTHFSGGDGPMSFSRTEKILNGLESTSQKLDLSMPLAVNGGKGLIEHHSVLSESGTAFSQQRTSHFLLPTKLLGQTGLVDYALVTDDKGAGVSESRTAKLVNPFTVGGKTYGLEESLVTLDQPTQTTETFVTSLTAPVRGVQASLQRQTVTVTTATGETEQQKLALVLPSVKISDRLSVGGQRVSTDNTGTNDQDLTDLNVSVSPLKPWQVQAKYTTDDKGPLATSQTRQLLSKLALGDKLRLEGRLTESEAPGVDSSLKLVEIVRDRGNSGLGLRAGFASFGALSQDIDAARRIEVCAGKPSALAISAAYSEYDPNSFTRFADDQTVALSVQHGDPNDLALRWRYEDQPTRVEPLQAVDLAMEALGGKLQVSYQSNPTTPDGKGVRQAAQYDASLGRKLFGEVNLQLGFRYLDYSNTDLIDQHYRIQMDGGNEARGGKIALSYFTGDFCPTSTTSDPTPGSKLDLTYSRLWGDEGKLKLTLQRQTPAPNTLTEGKTEGLLEYSRVF